MVLLWQLVYESYSCLSCGSIAEHLPGPHEALSSVSRTVWLALFRMHRVTFSRVSSIPWSGGKTLVTLPMFLASPHTSSTVSNGQDKHIGEEGEGSRVPPELHSVSAFQTWENVLGVVIFLPCHWAKREGQAWVLADTYIIFLSCATLGQGRLCLHSDVNSHPLLKVNLLSLTGERPE